MRVMRALFLLLPLFSGCQTPEPTVTSPKPVSSSAAPVTASSQDSSTAASFAQAPFVIAFVVDQFSAWVAEERLALLPNTGGFARLRKEGTWVKAMRLPYAVTDTAPGHASLHTGRVPAESGIWGNELPDRASGSRVSFLLDDAVHVVAPDAPKEPLRGSSPARLQVENVADRLRAARPDALIVSISVKDRGAIMPGGHKPTVALWFDARTGSFVTSTAFAEKFPAWAAPIANAEAVTKARAIPWTISDEAWIKENARVKDDAPGEGDLENFGTTFPHLAKTSAAFRASPASDRMILDLALASLDALYDRSKPTLLTLSMSACDVLGHIFGPDSWEAWDHLHKLDAALGAFFDAIETKVGGPPGNFSVVLAADHGNSSMPETVRSRRPPACAEAKKPTDPYERPICTAGTRIEPNDLQRDLRVEVTKSMGGTSGADYIEGIADPYVFLSEKARTLDAPKRKQVDDAIRRVFTRRKDQVEALYDVRELGTKCPDALARAKQPPARALAGEDLLTLVCRSWSDKTGAGDFYMVPKLGTVFDGEIVPNKGASHGGPWLYDRTIPLLIRGAGTDAMTVITDPVDFTAYSRVLSSLLELDKTPPREILQSLRAKR